MVESSFVYNSSWLIQLTLGLFDEENIDFCYGRELRQMEALIQPRQVKWKYKMRWVGWRR